ncbi:helix-turn-helix domain-containing protein [Tsukamurella sp. 8F]|uniref:helix-turn-helix domain-containing protein n=1 Tax=Tsukamurella sp. 8F TaxID=3031961 RepID=UPI0023BA1932|nr:helix-turn-helix domain-containing protein [Tsukamurella sp. 8F]MDF0588094.1 helix-turn-helix domain-containing protein [Tsukamurella sp. 8F]
MNTPTVHTDTAPSPVGPWLTTPEAAERLRVSRWTVHELARRGRLQAFRLSPGGPLRFKVADLDALLVSARPTPD